MEIPISEFHQRIEALRRNMEREGFDLLLSFGNEAEPQFVRYFSDYWPSFETAGVLVGLKGDPLLLIGPESLSYAEDRSKIPQIRLLKAFRESSEPEYPGKPLHTFEQVIEECMGGGKLSKLGVAGLSLMPCGIYASLCESAGRFGDVAIEKADKLVTDLRMIKSKNELGCMREAARITRLTFDHVLENIRPGMTETQVAGLALGKMHELGAERESYPLWVLSGAGSHQAISRPRHKALEKDELIHLQIGARVAGYASSIGRQVVFGKMSEAQRNLVEAGYSAQGHVIDALCAGVPAADVAKGYEKYVADLGYGDWLLYGPCHGNGLMEGEPPWIETSSTWTLEENMTFCVDIYLGSPKLERGLRVEDVVRVGAHGAENLTDYPRRLFEL